MTGDPHKGPIGLQSDRQHVAGLLGVIIEPEIGETLGVPD
ncbi:MAG: hypothetical protein ACI9EZ_002042 [Halobacteriales archaeon]|jgi:hypothetical protein